jgi:hypothetical protein
MASDWPLLTGGRCSEVAVNTGLTVLSKKKISFPFEVKYFFHKLMFGHLLQPFVNIVCSFE